MVTRESALVHTDALTESGIRLSGLQLPEILAENSPDDSAPILSLCQTTTYRWSLTDDLVHYPASGISAIGLYRPKVEEFEEDLAIDLIRSSNLTISSLSWIGGLTGCDGNPQAEALYDARESMRFAAAIQAGTVAIITGGLGRHIGKQAHRLMLDALRHLCDEAETLGLRLALHPFSSTRMKGRTLIRSLADTLNVIEKMNRPCLGILLDLQELANDPDLPGAVSSITPLVHCVRITDRRPRLGGERQRLSERLTGQAGLIRELVHAGYHGPIEIDLWSEHDHPVEHYDLLIRECRVGYEVLQSALGTAASER